MSLSSRRDTNEAQIHALLDDPDDPFGTRPDEKPPAGWDDRFWDEVRSRIENTQGGPEGGDLPDPGRWRRRGARALGAVVVMLCAAGLVRGLSGGWIATQRPAGIPPTVVSVVGSDLPDVAVDWARLNGQDSGFTVFRSIDPDISYVYLDPTLPALATRAALDDVVTADQRNGATPAGVGLIRMFRGRLLPSSQEVEVTTFFREVGFSPLAGTDGGQISDADMEEEIGAHARSIFSLGEVTPLGSGSMELHGGAVVFDGGPNATRLTIQGRLVGRDAARLLVSQSHAGREVVATSVVARRGRTILLAGAGRSNDELLLVAFTLL